MIMGMRPTYGPHPHDHQRTLSPARPGAVHKANHEAMNWNGTSLSLQTAQNP
jgi:hypothetical protein